MDLASTNFIVTLIIGGIVGWLASILMKTNAQMGILANVLIGIVGSFIGGAISYLLLGATNPYQPSGWIMSLIGAIVLLLGYRLIKQRTA